jgi:hypothetical protein
VSITLPAGRTRWVAAGVAAAALAVGLSIGLDDSSSRAIVRPLPGDEWRDAVMSTDLALMSQGTFDYVRIVNEWATNTASDLQVTSAATDTMVSYLEARDRLAQRAPFEKAPRALTDYREAVQLLIVHTRSAQVASSIQDPTLRHQAQLLLGRIRDLADRIYDLGNAELRPFMFSGPKIEGFNYERPADVPSFADSDLAPGPPLSHSPRAGGTPRVYEDVRPEQDWAGWADDVRSAGIPGPAEVTRILTAGSVPDLDQSANNLTAASDGLHAAPDPRGERTLSSRIQLGLLVQAEACRVAQIARLVPVGPRTQAREISYVLALIGNGMWDERLGVRELGFPTYLLTARPPSAPPTPAPVFEGP